MFAVGKKVGSGIEQIIYEHFLYVVKTETPARVIERFKSLFIEGVNYSDNRIWTTIETLAFEKTAEQNFPLVINRCCYILVNYWQMQPTGRVAVADRPFERVTEGGRTRVVEVDEDVVERRAPLTARLLEHVPVEGAGGRQGPGSRPHHVEVRVEPATAETRDPTTEEGDSA